MNLSKRDFFAALAMSAYIAGNYAWSDGKKGGYVSPSAEEAAKVAYEIADEMVDKSNSAYYHNK